MEQQTIILKTQNTALIILIQQVVYGFFTKDEETNFNGDIAYNNDDNFKSFNYEAELLGNTVADGNKLILKNSIRIVVPLK